MDEERTVEMDSDLRSSGESLRVEVEKIISEFFPNGDQASTIESVQISPNRYCHIIGGRMVISSSRYPQIEKIDRTIVHFMNGRIYAILLKNKENKLHSLTHTAENIYNKDGTVMKAGHYVKGDYLSKTQFKILNKIINEIYKENIKVMNLTKIHETMNKILKSLTLKIKGMGFE